MVATAGRESCGGQYIEAVLTSTPHGSSPIRSWMTHWPSQCAVCRSWDRGRLCGVCRERFAAVRPRCQRCASPLPTDQPACGACLRNPPAFDETIAAVDYVYPWDQLLARLKFHDALDLCRPLAQQLERAIETRGGPPVDWILPVPLSRERMAARGFNQAWEIARRLKARGRADAAILVRVRDTPHQLALPREQRVTNVRNAFVVEPARAALLRGADVAVVDDVLTTGATLAEIAGVLRTCGVRRVRAWVVARTPAPGD
jgi:ComF family protein